MFQAVGIVELERASAKEFGSESLLQSWQIGLGMVRIGVLV